MHKINFSIVGFDVSHDLHLCFIMTFVKITTFLAAACFCNHCIKQCGVSRKVLLPNSGLFLNLSVSR